MNSLSNSQLVALNAVQEALPRVQRRLDHYENRLQHVGMLKPRRQTRWEHQEGIQVVRIKAAYPFHDYLIGFRAVAALRGTSGQWLPHKVNYLVEGIEGNSDAHFEVMYDGTNRFWYTGGPVWNDEFPWDSYWVT